MLTSATHYFRWEISAMIEFGCKNCGQKLSVQDQHSGKRVKCPKCGSVGVVPDMNVDGSEKKRLTNNPAYDASPSWSPFLVSENKTMEEKK